MSSALRLPVRAPAAAALLNLALASALAAALAGCAPAASAPSATPTPALSQAPALSGAVAATADQVAAALGSVGLTATALPPQPVAYRPGESPLLAVAPRLVLQALLPGDASHGFIVVYQFADDATARAAGAEMAGYLASGPGRIQFPNDARHVLRQVGPTLVFFTWSPAVSPDPKVAALAGALETLGTGIPVVR
ncbi:MAG: hypothetical protein ABI628_02150 [Chloroflexota bacterium]